MNPKSVANYARSNEPYRYLRRKICDVIVAGDSAELNPFLIKSLFQIKKESFATFTFDKKDWRNLDRHRNLRDSGLNDRFLGLWANFVVENAAWLDEISGFSLKLNWSTLNDDSEAVFEAVNELSIEASQSLFVMKAIAALLVNHPEQVGSFFSRKLRSEWLKGIFIDGLISSTATTIPDSAFRDTSEFMLSNLEHRSEQEAIGYLLRPQLSQENTAFHAYIALVSHPFDALQLLTLELENFWARKTEVPACVLVKLRTLLTRDTPELRRLELILDLLEGGPISSLGAENVDPAISFIESFLGPEYALDEQENEPEGALVEAIKHCRATLYPDRKKWETLRVFTIHWGFSSIGKYINSFLHSMYLFPRLDQKTELLNLLPLIAVNRYIGAHIASAPSGLTLLKLVFGPVGMMKVKAKTDTQIDAPADYQCRFRFNAVHWQLQALEADSSPRVWIDFVRKNVPVNPNYLSGIRWSWLLSVNDKYRLSHFEKTEEDKFNYIYAFLVMMSEDDQAEPVPLRSMLKKLKPEDLKSLLTTVCDTLGSKCATALVRHYLSASEILHLQLAKNPFAGIATRLAALDHIKNEMGFDDIVTLDYFETESLALQKSLFARHVSHGQFEFSWPRLLVDAKGAYREYYLTAMDLIQSGEGKRLLGEAQVSLEHDFGNRQSASYRLPNHERQFATVLLAIIDEVLQHPVFGLEAILSSRFRHDTLERPFRTGASEIVKLHDLRLPRSLRIALHENYWPKVSLVLSDWIGTRLHSKRRSTPAGMFNLVPSQKDLSELVKSGLKLTDFEDVFELVQAWICKTLAAQLVGVRANFEGELNASLLREIENCKRSGDQDPRYTDAEQRLYLSKLAASIENTISETSGWFTIPEREAESPFQIDTPIEIAKQVCGVETNDISALFEFSTPLPADMRKPALYACIDIAANARKESTKLRVTLLDGCVVFSNLLTSPTDDVWEIKNKASNQEMVYAERGSGFTKISAGMSALAGAPVEIQAIRRRNAFHLLVPLKSILDGK